MARSLPQNIEAEQALLGTVMVYPKAMVTCFDNDLKASDFFSENNQKIFQVLDSLYQEKKPTDFTSLITRLKDLKILDEIGGVDYLSTLSDSVVSAYSAEHYINLIQEKSLLRNLISAAQSIVTESFDNSYEGEEVLDKAERLILDVTHARKTSDFKKIPNVIDTVMDTVAELGKSKGEPTGVKTGFKRLDSITHGLQRGDLIILAARPSVGKTAFALNIAVNASANMKKPIAVFSLEMPAEALTQRMLACLSEVNISNIRSGFFRGNEWSKLQEASSHLRELPIYLDDSPIIKMSEIFAKCRKLKNEHGLSLIIIDYLQLISPGRSGNESRQQQVSEISRNLKMLARDLDVPVIALSQLSRDIEKDQSKEKTKRGPVLSDLRESGAIEQDADIVVFLYNPDDSKQKKDNTVNLTVDIAKHRNGQITFFPLSFTKSCNAFYNIEEDVSEKEGE